MSNLGTDGTACFRGFDLDDFLSFIPLASCKDGQGRYLAEVIPVDPTALELCFDIATLKVA